MSKSPRDIINRVNKELEEKKIAPGLVLGSTAPNFSLLNQDGKVVRLSNLLGRGFVILSFYRGDWCGHCRKELIELQNNYDKIKSFNAQIVGISPQTPEKAKSLGNNLKITFPLLSDPKQETIRDYNIHFELHQEIQEVYQSNFKLNLPKLTANETWELPVPATFILNQNGIVVDKFVKMDYTKRIEINYILEFLKKNGSKMHFLHF